MESIYQLRHIEVGFFTASLREASVALRDFSFVHVPGLPVDQLQFWRLEVRSSNKELRHHLVLMSHFPLRSSGTCEEIARLLRPAHPGTVLVFTRADAEGRSEIHAESHAAEAAAAIAEVKRAGSWDDSPEFQVLVGTRAFTVGLDWSEDRAEARVHEGAS
jgi:hypothetical protein